MLAPSVPAHQIALKGGRVIQFEKYHVTENLLLYTDSAGSEVKIALNDIDFDRTRELSASDNPPLDLPGLNRPNPKQTNTASQPLGDVARSVRKKDAVTVSKRVITNDDVPSGSIGDGTSSGRTSGDKPESILRTMGNLFDIDRVTLGRVILRMANIDDSVRFPERVDWEFSLFDAKQEMARETIHASERPNDDDQQKLATRKYNEFQAIRSRGIQQARDYLKNNKRQ
jgi:hypothetical protein